MTGGPSPAYSAVPKLQELGLMRAPPSKLYKISVVPGCPIFGTVLREGGGGSSETLSRKLPCKEWLDGARDGKKHGRSPTFFLSSNFSLTRSHTTSSQLSS